MRKFTFSFKSLLVACLLMGGASSAWADSEVELVNGNRIGAENNSTGWYGQNSESVEIGHHKTLTLKFKTYTATDGELGSTPWNDQFTHAIHMWDGEKQDFFLKGMWGWKSHSGTANDPVDYDINDATYAFYEKSVGWGDDYRTMIGDGADVVMTIQRFGKKFRITQEFTTSSGAKYYYYLVGTFGTDNGSVWCHLTVDHAHVDITANKVLTDSSNPTITGTLIGSEDNSTAWWTAFSDYFYLKPNESLSLKIKNYSNKVFNYNNFVVYVTSDANRGSCTEYMGLRADKWVLVSATEATNDYLTTCPNTGGTDIDWDAFRDKLDGATVTINVTRSGASITTQAVIEPSDAGATMTESYTMDCGDGTQDVRVFLTGSRCHLDLLPVTTSISSYGWATFSSDYALDFSKATEGLEAYMITGHDGTVVTKSQVTGTVPAGTGLLLKGEEGDYNIPIVGSSSTNVSANLMKAGTGAAISAEGSKTKYVLGVSDNGTAGNTSDDYAEFQKIGGTAATVPTGKAYLQFDEVISVKSLSFIDDGKATGVDAPVVAEAEEDGVYYNTAGQQVTKDYKGIVIKNGKKYFNK